MKGIFPVYQCDDTHSYSVLGGPEKKRGTNSTSICFRIIYTVSSSSTEIFGKKSCSPSLSNNQFYVICACNLEIL